MGPVLVPRTKALEPIELTLPQAKSSPGEPCDRQRRSRTRRAEPAGEALRFRPSHRGPASRPCRPACHHPGTASAHYDGGGRAWCQVGDEVVGDVEEAVVLEEQLRRPRRPAQPPPPRRQGAPPTRTPSAAAPIAAALPRPAPTTRGRRRGPEARTGPGARQRIDGGLWGQGGVAGRLVPEISRNVCLEAT